jgi:fructose-1,6-bisphosphatase II
VASSMASSPASASARSAAPSPGPGGGAGSTQRFAEAALAATRAAALAAQRYLGRGDPHGADGAATAAMRAVLADVPGRGEVVIGEGEKDGAPMLYNGEQLGTAAGPRFDIAVDPLEGTKVCAAGMPGALATIAIAPGGSLWRPGPSYYMDKLVVGPRARGAIEITRPPEWNAASVAEALDKPPSELRIVILDKPRHRDLISRMRELGASVQTPADGDVAGALDVLLADGTADLLMGIGGTPEGVMTACAAAALGGEMQGRLAPQRDDERQRLIATAVQLERPLRGDELAGTDAVFAACGVSGGELLRGPWSSDGEIHTESLLITRVAVRRVVQAASPEGGASDEGQRPAPAVGSGHRRRAGVGR